MELLFVTVIAAGIGAGLRMLLPGRTRIGLLVVPAISTAVAAIVWVGLTWLGFGWDGGWIWLITLVLAAVAPIPVALRLPGARDTADAEALGIA